MKKIIEKENLVPGRWYFWTKSNRSSSRMAAVKIKEVGNKVKYDETFTGNGIHLEVIRTIEGSHLIEINSNDLDIKVLDWINNLPEDIQKTLPF